MHQTERPDRHVLADRLEAFSQGGTLDPADLRAVIDVLRSGGQAIPTGEARGTAFIKFASQPPFSFDPALLEQGRQTLPQSCDAGQEDDLAVLEILQPADSGALALSISELEAWDGERDDSKPLTVSEIESVALVLHELKRLQALQAMGTPPQITNVQSVAEAMARALSNWFEPGQWDRVGDDVKVQEIAGIKFALNAVRDLLPYAAITRGAR